MKRHFIFLGVPGIIYYSWLLALVFIGVCVAYESNKSLSIPSLVLCSLFGILLIYTLIYSYFEEDNKKIYLKLPYRKKTEVSKLQLMYQWHAFEIYKIKDEYENYYVLTIKRKKNANGNWY